MPSLSSSPAQTPSLKSHSQSDISTSLPPFALRPIPHLQPEAPLKLSQLMLLSEPPGAPYLTQSKSQGPKYGPQGPTGAVPRSASDCSDAPSTPPLPQARGPPWWFLRLGMFSHQMSTQIAVSPSSQLCPDVTFSPRSPMPTFLKGCTYVHTHVTHPHVYTPVGTYIGAHGSPPIPTLFLSAVIAVFTWFLYYCLSQLEGRLLEGRPSCSVHHCLSV